jgi:Family of unknown function (DUF6221)
MSDLNKWMQRHAPIRELLAWLRVQLVADDEISKALDDSRDTASIDAAMARLNRGPEWIRWDIHGKLLVLDQYEMAVAARQGYEEIRNVPEALASFENEADSLVAVLQSLAWPYRKRAGYRSKWEQFE